MIRLDRLAYCMVIVFIVAGCSSPGYLEEYFGDGSMEVSRRDGSFLRLYKDGSSECGTYVDCKVLGVVTRRDEKLAIVAQDLWVMTDRGFSELEHTKTSAPWWNGERDELSASSDLRFFRMMQEIERGNFLETLRAKKENCREQTF